MSEQIQADIKFNTEDQNELVDPHPWMSHHSQSIFNPIVRFHNEVIDFANYVEPSLEEHQTKLTLLSTFENQVKKYMEYATVMSPFVKNKLYMKKTQMGIYIIINENQPNWQLNCIEITRRIAEQMGIKIFNLSIQISEQQCRIIGQHQENKTQIWMHFVPSSWKLFISEIDNSLAMYVQIKYLYLVTYCMVRQRALQSVISCLLIYGLCSFFLHERRKQRVRTLTENIIKFLQFYSISFIQDKQRKVVYVQGNIFNFNINSDKVFKFQIAEKVDLSCRKLKDLFKVFHNRYKVLGYYYYAPGTSVLTHLINPCMGTFFY